MATFARAPKQWCLSKEETVNSFENWRQNLIYTLSLDQSFGPYLTATWLKKTKTNPLRGFNNDGDNIPVNKRRTAAQKVTMLELMLGQIANYCPVISRSTVVKNSTSLGMIWQYIRLHYGFQSTGAHFIDFSNIRLKPDERPEDLFQRLMAFIEDNLLCCDGGITHHGEQITDDEELSPSLENFVVLTWLRLLHPDLPQLVKQRYGTELRSRTLASIKPEISQALTSLLDEIHSIEGSKVMRAQVSRPSTFSNPPAHRGKQTKEKRSFKTCPLCKEAGRYDKHFLSECSYLPDKDRKYMAKIRHISNIIDESDEENDYDENSCIDENPTSVPMSGSTSSRRVMIRQSPYLDAFVDHQTIRITVDSGATGNMIRLPAAKRLGVKITKSSQSAHQADGSSTLTVIGETKFNLVRDNITMKFDGLVVEDLDVDILAGTPFMEMNDVCVRPARRQVLLNGTKAYQYGSCEQTSDTHSIRRAHVLRAPPQSTVVWPGEFIELELPAELSTVDDTYALEPRLQAHKVEEKPSQMWPQPDIVNSVSGKLRVPNLTDSPQSLKRGEHFCQIQRVFVPTQPDDASPPIIPDVTNKNKTYSGYSEAVRIDPDNIFSSDIKSQFKTLHSDYDNVFNPKISVYNGASGNFKAVINMGPTLPPQRKGRVPQYAHNKLAELQSKFDELEQMNVFMRPEDAHITVEYLNPSFLVKKSNGGHRLVTAFSDVGRYCKPQPAIIPDIDSTLRKIAQWKYLITSDLSNAYYQIPLAPQSMKYCGVASPFKGVYVYTRCAMGMPGSETALEELMSRVLGDIIQDGVVAKIADDIYCGGNTPSELLHNWSRVLQAMQNNNLTLSAKKTIIGPRTTTILGWIWHQGTLQASPHRVSTLANCSPPVTVSALRSFMGAYKVLARVIPRCSSILAPLDKITAGGQPSDKIMWTEDSLNHFQHAQSTLASNHTIVLPRPSDQLWIVTDGAVKNNGIGATLYITRGNKLHLSAFFSAKLRGKQITWLPCEIEALSIATAVKHFSPYIIQSNNTPCILTDSKPCVQAHEKLCRGEFSASPRVSTFLSTISQYQASVRHLAGNANIPSDFASRNALECNHPNCQVCSFITKLEDSVVRHITVSDIISGKAKLPFTSRSAWLSLQAECPDLRRTHAHLHQGTRPSKKITNIKDVKRYLNVGTISRDGLLVVRREDPLSQVQESIIVPRQILNGLLTALHIKLDHPSAHQLKKICKRYFFALDMDKAIANVSDECYQCASLRKTPHTVITQTTGDPPESVGISFAADVLKRERQLILVVRECTSSFTVASLIESERHDVLRDGLIRLCIELRPIDGPNAVIRTDPAPGFTSLVNDEQLHRLGLAIEIGRIKNQNKNPVAERAVQELTEEILRQNPLCGPVNSTTLALATARLNTRIRSSGLSAREMWTQRDQFTNCQIPLSDHELIRSQHTQRLTNHSHSEKAKAPKGAMCEEANVEVGDLIYLHNDRNKSRPRDRYLVVAVEGSWCNARKFVGSQLRNTSYRVKRTECFKVSHMSDRTHIQRGRDSTSDDEFEPVASTPTLPGIPPTLSTPAADTKLHKMKESLHPEYEVSQVGDIDDNNLDHSDGEVDSETRIDDVIQPDLNLRRSSRISRPPSHMRDYITKF